ncbi:V-type ATPase subunit [Roseburia sp. 499]|uniref:V-type ATPase subunit n=1 Tax=Roseburia sp. 499 TaxID=1261634 RepID=UPI00095219BE|nr:V-type ATPase subunit [Roseburia sp. 499]WVK71473.1 V-type ATPase subunit [Roseburia sp. 499]
MAGELLQYSGLITKIKAMEGRLLTREDYEHILEFQTVNETIAFLREQQIYGKIYGGHDEIQHRGQVEALIYNSIREDYESICRFCNPVQRKALRLYEKQVQYENAVPQLDTSYFTEVWKKISIFRQKKMKEILREVFGTQIDWLNIMWMYRAKRFFGQNEAEIYAILIPAHYKLKKSEIQHMAEAGKIEDFLKIVGNTAYFKGKEALVQLQDEVSYHQVMQRMYRRLCRKYPVSLAPVFSYLYQKEQEIQRLTSALEGIRYQVPEQDIRTLVLGE